MIVDVDVTAEGKRKKNKERERASVLRKFTLKLLASRSLRIGADVLMAKVSNDTLHTPATLSESPQSAQSCSRVSR